MNAESWRYCRRTPLARRPKSPRRWDYRRRRAGGVSGYIKANVCVLERRKLGLNAHIFAQVKLSANGRADVSGFSEAIKQFPEVLDCFVLMGSVDFMLRIVAEDINAYERFFFEKLSQVPGVQEINSMVALSEIKSTTVLPYSRLRCSELIALRQRGRTVT